MLSRAHRAIEVNPALASGLLGGGVFLLSLFGIFTRPHLDLASFWPANAFLLGMMVRFPGLARPLSWVCGVVGFFLADALTGSGFVTNIVLNGGNMIAILAGYTLLRPLSVEDRALQGPASMVYFMRAVLAASVAAGLVGIVANPLLFGRSWREGFTFWLVTELVNSMAFLPMILTLPSVGGPLTPRLAIGWQDVRHAAPIAALALSAAAGILIGGPGALAIPVPALLWCALTYSLFTTSCLAFVYGAWSLLAIRAGILPVGAPFSSRALLLSVRLGVTLIALGPLVVASVTAARNRLLVQLRLQVERDVMTGLRNRRAFLASGTALVAQGASEVRIIAAMMLDIDHFKAVNDRYGHDAGDRVLVRFAEILEANVRPGDVVGRMGGEEFAIILPGCDVEAASAAAARINAVCRQTAFRLEDGREIRVTVSIGVHVGRSDVEVTRLLSHADRALYRAKNGGRDRYEVLAAVGELG